MSIKDIPKRLRPWARNIDEAGWDSVDGVVQFVNRFDHDDLAENKMRGWYSDPGDDWWMKFGEPRPDSIEDIRDPACERCGLHETANTVNVPPDVVPDDPTDVEILFVGDRPKAQEDETGAPFVSNSGSYLRRKIGDPEYAEDGSSVYEVEGYDGGGEFVTEVVDAGETVFPKCALVNVVNCKTPNGRNPEPGEQTSCRDQFLERYIEYMDPDVVVALGGVAIQNVFGKKGGGVRKRRTFHEDPRTGRRYYGMYHPNRVLRSHELGIFFHKDLASIVGRDVGDYDPNVHYVGDESDLDSLGLLLRKRNEISYDVESTSLSPYLHNQNSGEPPRLLCLSVAVEGENGFVVPISHEGDRRGEGWKENVVDALREPLHDESKRVRCHNWKFDALYTWEELGIEMRNGLDTAALSFLDDERNGTSSLSIALQEKLNFCHKGEVDLLYERLKKSERDYSNLPWGNLAPYSALDAPVLFPLGDRLEDELSSRDAERSSWDNAWDGAWKTIMKPGIRTFFDMEQTGIPVHYPVLNKHREELPKKLEEIRSEIRSMQAVRKFEEWQGEPINLNSPKQVRILLFDTPQGPEGPPPTVTKEIDGEEKEVEFEDHLGCPWVKLTDSGKPSVSTKKVTPELKRRAHNREVDNPKQVGFFCEWYEKWQKYSQRYSTFVDGLEDYIYVDDRIHPNHNLTTARTGRTSSSKPNMQNLEKKSGIRDQFKAPDGWYWFSYDFSQLELRVMASLSKDETMLKVFREGLEIDGKWVEDIHKTTMYEMRKKVDADGIKVDRDAAKRTNFGISYGQTPEGLAQMLLIPVDVAEAFIDSFWERYPGVMEYKQRVIEFCEENLYVESPTGRRRHLPSIGADSEYKYEKAARRAFNFPVQSVASDINIYSSNRVQRKLLEEGFDTSITDRRYESRLGMNVHDENNMLVPEDELHDVYDMVTDEAENMEAFDWVEVPMEVDVEIGRTWGSLTEVSEEAVS